MKARRCLNCFFFNFGCIASLALFPGHFFLLWPTTSAFADIFAGLARRVAESTGDGAVILIARANWICWRAGERETFSTYVVGVWVSEGAKAQYACCAAYIMCVWGAPTCRAKVLRARAHSARGRGERGRSRSDAPRRNTATENGSGSFADMTANRIHVALIGVSYTWSTPHYNFLYLGFCSKLTNCKVHVFKMYANKLKISFEWKFLENCILH